MSDHELTIRVGRDVLVVDNQPRGGLLIQIGYNITRDSWSGDYQSIRIPKRFADELRKFLASPPKPRKKRTR